MTESRKKWTDWIDFKIGLGSIITGGIVIVGFCITLNATLNTVADLKTTVNNLVSTSIGYNLTISLANKDIATAQRDITNLQNVTSIQQTAISRLTSQGVGWDSEINSVKERYNELVPTHGFKSAQ